MMHKKIAALCAVVVGVSAGSSFLNHFFTGGYQIVVEGKTIGYVENSDLYEKALTKVNETLATDVGEEYTLDPQVEIKGVIVGKDQLSTESELHDNIAQLSSYMTEGYVLMVDGTDVCHFKSMEDAQSALSIVRTQFNIPDGISNISEKTEIVEMQISSTSITSPEEAAKLLLDEGKMTVKTTVDTVYHTTKDYKTVEQTDETLIKGNRKTLQEGQVGEYVVTAVVEYRNGVQVGKSIKSEELISDAVDEIVAVGTYEVPDMGTGTFTMPSTGEITSTFGPRWGRTHTGIDIAAATGTPIKAADTGVVIFTGYQGTYGNLVKIDHKNGYVTYYAHCSEILVNVGESVTQGQQIAKVGSTGNSTGPHDHFEIQLNGTAVNPLNYVK